MTLNALRDAVALADKVRMVFVEALDREAVHTSEGMAGGEAPVAPRLRQIACARSLSSDESDRVTVDDWYAPETVDGLNDSPAVAIVVWDAATGGGYHLFGELEGGLERAAGVGSALQRRAPRLSVRVGKVVAFGHAAV